MRILHVLHTTVPDTSGYSIRSKCILDFQRQLGIQQAAVSSCRHPNNCATEETIDGVQYHRTPAPPSGLALNIPLMRERSLMRQLYSRVFEVAQEFKPDVIHAHSPVLCGMPAADVARRLGIPFIYEVRDFWENASVDKGKFRQGSLQYRIARRAETALLRRSDAVIAICRGLGREVQARGIPEERIWLAPNGVDHSRFVPRSPSPELAERSGVKGCQVIGYIGSFFRYEGLETLISAMPMILSHFPNAKLLMVGSGDEGDRLQEMTKDLGIADQVIFTGRVPHQEVPNYYALADLLVYPRIETPTTRLTTPLKPLEAMAMGRPVVGSDVPAMKELITDGRDGLLFRSGNPEHLAMTVIQLLQKDALRGLLAENARRTVLDTRDWRRIIQVYPAAYKQVMR